MILRIGWMTKMPDIFHHNQLLKTKFRRILQMWKMTTKVQQRWQIIEQLTEKTWGWDWFFLPWVQNGETFHLFHEEEIGKLLVKNIARTAGRKLNGTHLLFGEYLHYWTTLNLLNLPINRQLTVNLTLMEVSTF